MFPIRPRSLSRLSTYCRRSLATSTHAAERIPEVKTAKKRLIFDNKSPSFHDFLASTQKNKPIDAALIQPDRIPYLQAHAEHLGKGKKFYIEVYGCQVKCVPFYTFCHSPPLFFTDECEWYRNIECDHDPDWIWKNKWYRPSPCCLSCHCKSRGMFYQRLIHPSVLLEIMQKWGSGNVWNICVTTRQRSTSTVLLWWVYWV